MKINAILLSTCFEKTCTIFRLFACIVIFNSIDYEFENLPGIF